MLFNSLEFLIFFPIVFILYFTVVYLFKKNWLSQVLLLIASLFFYACWKPTYLFLILLSVIITWICGMLLQVNKGKYKRLILFISLFLNLAILIFFKYFNFISDSFNNIFNIIDIPLYVPNFEILLPVGISFYTFQALGYTIDVYRGTINAERNFLTYALFVTFFPQLVAGPIERSSHLLPQFKINNKFDYHRITDGLRLTAWGLFKKVVIADRLSLLVNSVYNDVTYHTGITLVIATVFFAFQILCDFSGYSDIAIGVSKILGFDLMINFRQPYLAKSIPDFWRRWHISLSTWFKDYLYIPLGGNRVSSIRHYFNILLTFTISGLWHGANWTFIIWGLLHGLFQIVYLLMASRCNFVFSKLKIDKESFGIVCIRVLVTFSLVCFAWIFFRSNSLSDALYIVKNIWSFPEDLLEMISQGRNILGTFGLSKIFIGIGRKDFLVSVLVILTLIISDLFSRNNEGLLRYSSKPIILRWIGYYSIIFCILFLGMFGSSEFIYFQF